MDGFLQEVFQFRSTRPSSSQSLQIIQETLQELQKFSSSLFAQADSSSSNERQLSLHFLSDVDGENNPADRFLAPEVEAVQCAFDRLTTPGNFPPRWFPAYGCAILFTDLPRSADLFHIRLIGLDSWKFVQFRQYQDAVHTAAAKDLLVWELGELPEDQLPNFLNRLDALLSDASKRSGKDRTAAQGRQGHQKTPAFIHCLARQAFVDSDEQDDFLPLGGTTDVGLHTGGAPRGTSWPLVQAMLRTLLPSELLFDKVMLSFYLYLLEGHIQDIESRQGMEQSLDPVCDIDVVFSMLDAVVCCANDFKNISDVVDRVCLARKRLENLVEKFSRASSNKFSILKPASQHHKFPRLSFDILTNPTSNSNLGNSLAVIKRRALTNILWLPSIVSQYSDLRYLSFSSVRSWVIAHPCFRDGKNTDAAVLVFSQVSRLLFERSDSLINPAPTPLPDGEIKALDNIVRELDSLLSSWLASAPDLTHLMIVLIRSKQLLVVWTIYCLVHQQCALQFRLMKDFSIPLQPEDLKYLSIDDISAARAMVNIVRYIRTINRQPQSPPLFSLQDPSGTLKFASDFARESREMKARWDTEVRTRTQRKINYWDQVLQKQEQAEQLRSTLPDLERAIASAEMAKNEAYNKWNGIRGSFFYRPYQDAEAKLTSARQSLESCQSQIKNTIVPPHFIVSPLPSTFSLASCVIFFFMMPNTLDILSRLCIEAQRMLMPRQPTNVDLKNVNARLRESANYPSWASHYSSHSNSGDQESDRNLIIFPKGEVPHRFGPSTVDAISDGEQGIWYPDYDHGIVSSTGQNPFKLVNSWTRSFFTEDLPSSLKHLSWAIAYPEANNITSARGNEVFSKIAEGLPDSFNNKSFQAFGSLRSFPCQQFRKLVDVLHDRKLPLDHTAVRTLIRMALYQFGELSDNENQLSQWRRDMLEFGGLDTLHCELSLWADHLRHIPRDHKCIMILGESYPNFIPLLETWPESTHQLPSFGRV